MTAKPLCPSHGYKEAVHIPVGLLTCVSSDDPPAFSEKNPMTDFRQRQAISTLTAPAARGLSPHSLVQPGIRMPHVRPREQFIHLYRHNKKRLWPLCPLNRQNITITILGKYSIDSSRSPDSRLKRSNILPSQVAPMTGFRQRMLISTPTVLVNAGIWKKS